jgi:hypothetical protein
MKIKNDGRCKIVFDGGELAPKQVAVFKGEAEKLGAKLLSRYSFLVDLDNLKEDVIEVKTIGETAEGNEETQTPKKKSRKKSRK